MKAFGVMSGRTVAKCLSGSVGRLLLIHGAGRLRLADEWLLLPAGAGGRGRITAIAPVARRVGGRATVRGWCCALSS